MAGLALWIACAVLTGGTGAAAREWSVGTVTSFSSTSGHWTGTVYAVNPDPKPTCGWKMQLYLNYPVTQAPVINKAAHKFSLSTMDWFEFGNLAANGDLAATPQQCTNMTVQAVGVTATGHPNRQPEFEVRMHCACYDVKVDHQNSSP